MGKEFWFWGKQTKKQIGVPFGGKVDENITQALCRIDMGDIMMYSRVAKRNWSRDIAHICLTVHDREMVCAVKTIGGRNVRLCGIK